MISKKSSASIISDYSTQMEHNILMMISNILNIKPYSMPPKEKILIPAAALDNTKSDKNWVKEDSEMSFLLIICKMDKNTPSKSSKPRI